MPYKTYRTNVLSYKIKNYFKIDKKLYPITVKTINQKLSLINM